jgi:hypothetical protein
LLSKKATGLDLRADGWTLLSVERRGRAGEESLAVVKFVQGKWGPETGPEARGEILRAAFRQQKISRQGLVVSLPAGLGQWERLVLPGLSAELIKKALLTNLEAKLSRPPEEMALAYRVRREGAGASEVEAYVYPQQAAASCRQILHHAGLRRYSLFPRPYGIANYLLACSEHLRREGQQVFVVEISSSETGVFLLGREGIIHHRSFPSPLTPDGAYNLEALAEELKLTRFLLRKKRRAGERARGTQAPQAADTGAGAWRTANPVFAYLSSPFPETESETVRKTVAESLGLDPDRVAFLSSLRPLAGLSAGEWEQPGVLAAAGLALERLGKTGSGMRLSLPGEKEPPGRREFLSWNLLLLAFFLGAGGIFFHFDTLRKERVFLQEWLQRQEPELIGIRRLLAREERLREKIDRYSALEKERQFFFIFLAEWERVVTPGTIITSLTLEGDRISRLSGQTPSFSLFYEALLASPFFRDLQVTEGITTNQEGLEVFHLAVPAGTGRGEERGK